MQPVRPNDRAATNDAVQKAVDELVDSGAVEIVEEDPKPFRMIGVVLVPAAYSTSDTDEAEPPTATDADTAAVQTVLSSFSQIEPKDAPDRFTEFCTDPYFVVDRATGPQRMDEDELSAWAKHIGSDEFNASLGGFESLDPRRIEMTRVEVSYVGTGTAIVTFHQVEQGQGGKRWVGNGAAIVLKQKSGDDWAWKISVITKRGEIEEAHA